MLTDFCFPVPFKIEKKKNRRRVYYPLLFALQGQTLNTEPTQYYAPPKNQQSQRTLLQETPNPQSNTGFVGGKGNHTTGSRAVNHFLLGLVHVDKICHWTFAAVDEILLLPSNETSLEYLLY